MVKVRKRTQVRGTKDASKKKKKVSESAGEKGEKELDDFFKSSRDEELLSEDDERDGGEKGGAASEEEEAEAVDLETADEKRLRLAKAYLSRTREAAAAADDDEDEETAEQRRGARDSMVADLLQQEQLEESGRVQRKLAARVVKPIETPAGRAVGRKHRQAVTAICLTEDDSVGFAGSKDGLLVQWNIETGHSDKYDLPSLESFSSSTANGRNVQGKKGAKKQGSRHILALAVSSDGRYLATGGLDRAVHLWDTRTRQHIQAFSGHRGAVTSLVFRQGTQQLMSASLDRTIKLWSVEDRSYIDTLYGHQSEVLSIDCLRQERVLSAGRDRTLRIFKIPEESQLVFRGHAAHMESCCFISNGEFLSGSDDGCVALWNTIRKKPVFIARNAHGPEAPQETADTSSAERPVEEKINKVELVNGNSNGSCGHHQQSTGSLAGIAESWVGSVAVCRGSDLAASGAGDGFVRLWAMEDTNRSLQALHKLPVKGFVNSLKFARSGRFLLAGTGQEPRMGRWGRNPSGRNGVILHSILFS